MSDTAQLNFGVNEETKAALASGIPLGAWEGTAQTIVFRRQSGTSKKTGKPYDIRTLRVPVNALQPLSGEDVNDGAIQENLGNLSYEVRAGGVDRTLKAIGKIVEELQLDVNQNDVDELVQSVSEAVDADGTIDYDRVGRAIGAWGKQHVKGVAITFDLTYDDGDDFAPYKAENLRPAV